MSTPQVTTYAAWLVGLAIAALIATGWRRSARASADLERLPPPPDAAAPLAETPAPLDAPTPWLKKVWSAVAGFGLAIWVGAAAATIIGFGTAYLVITLTDMLKR